ncbi:hypothetical protein [Pseudomaricurvus sp.]
MADILMDKWESIGEMIIGWIVPSMTGFVSASGSVPGSDVVLLQI